MAKNLVIYHYFEKDVSYRNNLLHFLAFGVVEQADYIVIMSGAYTIELPQIANVRYYFTPAKKSDFGGYSQLINDGLSLLGYEYIYFVNSSVRGPFIAPYLSSTWLDIFANELTVDGNPNPEMGMVGTSICVLDPAFRHSVAYQERFGGNPPFSHVQTMAYVLPRAVLQQLIASGFYQEDRDSTKSLAIENYEIHLSQLILQQGKNIRCLLPEFNQIDYRQPHSNPNPTSTIGDPNETLGYFGRSVHPYEVLFVKINRHLYTQEYLDRLAYSMEVARKKPLPIALAQNRDIQSYLARIKNVALSGQAVSDFSYLPGDLDNREKLAQAIADRSEMQAQLKSVLQSTSWKVTRPLRLVKDWLSSKGSRSK